jgi:hypothetical protein
MALLLAELETAPRAGIEAVHVRPLCLFSLMREADAVLQAQSRHAVAVGGCVLEDGAVVCSHLSPRDTRCVFGACVALRVCPALAGLSSSLSLSGSLSDGGPAAATPCAAATSSFAVFADRALGGASERVLTVAAAGRIVVCLLLQTRGALHGYVRRPGPRGYG